MIIDMPFNQWSLRKLNEGIKTCTTRRHQKGKSGDEFFVHLPTGIKRYVLTNVVKVKLSVVYHYELIEQKAHELQSWDECESIICLETL